jgi:hypothetical protein
MASCLLGGSIWNACNTCGQMELLRGNSGLPAGKLSSRRGQPQAVFHFCQSDFHVDVDTPAEPFENNRK